jgi:hypothetical protein
VRGGPQSDRTWTTVVNGAELAVTASRSAADPVEHLISAVVGEAALIRELQHELLRAHHRIGVLALEARTYDVTAAGRPLERCASAIGKSRHWLARHAQACAAVSARGCDLIEDFVRQPTADGGVLSVSQYLEYGALRSGEARRQWRLQTYGESPAGKAVSGSSASEQPPQTRQPEPQHAAGAGTVRAPPR